MQPAESFSSLDLLTGFALFGVLLINLLYFFRVSLWDHILRFHSGPGRLNHAIDIFAAGVVEFIAFNLFALTFGIGMALILLPWLSAAVLAFAGAAAIYLPTLLLSGPALPPEAELRGGP